MWQGACCQRDNQANVFEILKNSSQSNAQWSELSHGPLCIRSRSQGSSGFQIWQLWLHASLSNVRLLSINWLILML